jgi:magnesium transporter
MARFIKSKKETIGLSPDSMIFRGEKKSDHVRLRVIDFDAGHLEEREIQTICEAGEYNHSKSITWLNIDGLHDEAIMHEIASLFKIDSLLMSDVLETDARPKIYEYEDTIFISAKMLYFDKEEKHISTENLSLIIKDNILLSFQERVGDVFEPVRKRIRNPKKRIRKMGVDYLAFALLDVVIDNYIYIISQIGEHIEALEEKLVIPQHSTIQEINQYKREINYLRKTIKPCREMILSIPKIESDILDERADILTRELQENINLAHESVFSYHEILTDQLNVYHTRLSDKLNNIIKFLTIFSVIFIPLTFIAGVYGTNFEYIPELQYKYSYFIMWSVMILVAFIMIINFKRKKWL